MQTAKMVRLDWQRNVLDPNALPCLRTFLTKNLVGDTQLVSLKPASEKVTTLPWAGTSATCTSRTAGHRSWTT